MNARRWLLAATIFGLPQYCLAHTTDSGDGHQLEEIFVTAQRREQSFNTVGIAVTAIGGDEVAKLGYTQLADIAGQTPNVQIKNVMANSITNVTIRGIGLNDYAANNNPAAGIYVDEVYQVSPAMLTFSLLDLERIEVLKGPQGTLYGRNTTAGTVNFISRKPGDTVDARAQLDYGNYDYKRFDGAVGGPMTDTLSGRVALSTVQQGDGYQTNRLNGKKIGEIDRTSMRAQLAWQPSDAVDVLLNVHGGRDHSDVVLLKVDNLGAPEGLSGPDPDVSGASNDPHMDLEAEGAALTVNWSLSDSVKLTAISGYENFKRHHVEDRDGSSLEQLDGTYDNDIEQFSQEARLTYTGDSLVLVGGAFYGEDTVQTHDEYNAPDLVGTQFIGNTYRQKTESIAAFLHAEYSLSPSWKLTAGARWTDDDKTFGNATTFLDTGTVYSEIFPPASNQFSSQNVSGKLGLDYTGIENTLLYASVSRGFKSGGFQGQLTFNPADLQPFDDETLVAYEVGLKTRLLDNTLQLNSAAFQYDYQDMQFYGGLFDSPVGVLFGIKNVGEARVRGLEADLWWRPVRGLDIRLGGGWLDTEVTKSVVAGVASGSELPNSPRYTLNQMIRYSWPVLSSLQADVTLAGNYQDDVKYDIVRSPPDAEEDGYFIADARLGIGAADERWGVYAWVKNIADERYRTQVALSSVGYVSSWAPPRTYGVSFTIKH